MGEMGKKMSPKTKKDSKRTVLVFREQTEKIESRILNEHILSRDIKRDWPDLSDS